MKERVKTAVSKAATGFTKEVPEHCTLLELATCHSVKAFEIEHVDTGMKMICVYFDHGGFHHLYQDGDGAGTKHLYFWVCAWEHDESPKSMALGMFNHSFILSE